MSEKPKRSRTRKILIGFSILLGAGAVIAVIGLIAVLAWLPAPADLSALLNVSPSAEPKLESKTEIAAQPELVRSAEPTPKPKKFAPINASMTDEEIRATMRSEPIQILYRVQIERLFDEDPANIQVCESLGKVSMTPEELQQPRSLYEMISSREESAINQAFFSSLVLAFHLPEIRDIYELAQSYDLKTKGLSEAEKGSWLKKAGFYSEVASRMASLFARSEDLESLGAQSSTFMDLARLTALRPAIGEDREVQALCRDAESAAKSGSYSDPTIMKARVDDLLARENLKRSDIGELSLLEARAKSKNRSH